MQFATLRYLGRVSFLLLCLPPLSFPAAEIPLGSYRGADWAVEWLRMAFGEAPGAGSPTHHVQLSAEQIELPPPLGTLRRVLLDCPAATLSGARFECLGGRLRLEHEWLDEPELGVALRYDPRDGSVQVSLSPLRLAGGKLRVEVRSSGSIWEADLAAEGLDAARLRAIAEQALAISLPIVISGRVGATGRVEAGADGAVRAHVEAQLGEVGLHNSDYSVDLEEIGGTIGMDLSRQGAGWRFSVDTVWGRGRASLEPLYLEVDREPVRLQARGRWRDEGTRLELSSFSYSHPGVMELTGDARLSLGEEGVGLERLSVHVPQQALAELYRTYARPFLGGDESAIAEVSGTAGLELLLRSPDQWSGTLSLADVAARDGASRFELSGLEGRLSWAESGEPRRCELAWRDGRLFGLSVGGTRMRAVLEKDVLRFPERVQIPIADGALLLDDLRIGGLMSGQPSVILNGVLTPISMETISAAAGWPQLRGKLSGIIPGLSAGVGGLRVEGNLLVQVFAGSVVISDLRLQDPLGALPVVQMDARIQSLDLDVLTGTFAFGKITGKLDGAVEGLVLEGWQPVAFDAWVATPKDEPGPRRISQRAVDNLTALGGGASGVLSQSLLGLFEDFPYERLGLSCRLRAGVCSMNGIGPAKQGYYILRGRGLPRIDIIGYRRQVDWNELVARLGQAIQAQGKLRIE